MNYFKWTIKGMTEVQKGPFVTAYDYEKLEAENARLRQQRDAANAQLDFILENLNNESK